MYKIVPETDAEFCKLNRKDYGGFNDFPPNWTAITEQELFENPFYLHYSPHHFEYRQMLLRDKKGNVNINSQMVSATLYFFHDGSGYATEFDCNNKKINYFKFCKCIHDFGPEVNPDGFNCLHTFVCKKCGYVRTYDSSD